MSEDFDDDFDQYVAAGLNITPSTPPPTTSSVLGKRTQREDDSIELEEAELDGRGDDSPDTDSALGSVDAATPPVSGANVNMNLVAYTKKLAAAKKLRIEETHELLEYLTEDALAREVRQLANSMLIIRKLDKLIADKPPWQPSPDLKVNIKSYSLSVLLSSRLSTYKGTVPQNHVLNILKRKRFDLPQGVEHIPADWKKVKTMVDSALTQHRSDIKKAIVKSVQGQSEDHWTIFELITHLCNDTECTASVPLCARVAFLRRMYLKNKGRDMWDVVNNELGLLRNKTKGNDTQVVLFFRGVLQTDRKLHGAGRPTDDGDFDTAVPEQPGAWQEEVDNMVAGISM